MSGCSHRLRENLFRGDTASLLLALALISLFYYGLTQAGSQSKKRGELPADRGDYAEVVNLTPFPLAVSIARMRSLAASNEFSYPLSEIDWNSIAPGYRVVLRRGKPPSVAGIEPMAPSKRIALGIPIDINSATQRDLEALPGIGSVRAKRIIELRRNRGGFDSIYDLLELEGIGVKTVETLAPYTTAD